MNEISWIACKIKTQEFTGNPDSKRIPKILRTFGNFLPEAPEEVYGASGESLRSLWKKFPKRLEHS